MKAHHSTVGKNDEWLTPPTIIEALGPFDLDPCAPGSPLEETECHDCGEVPMSTGPLFTLKIRAVHPRLPDLDGVCIKYHLDAIVRQGLVPGLEDDSQKYLDWSTFSPLTITKGPRGALGMCFRSQARYSAVEHLFCFPVQAPTYNRVLAASKNVGGSTKMKHGIADLVSVVAYAMKTGYYPEVVTMTGYKRSCNMETFWVRYFKNVLGYKKIPKKTEQHLASLPMRGEIEVNNEQTKGKNT